MALTLREIGGLTTRTLPALTLTKSQTDDRAAALSRGQGQDPGRKIFREVPEASELPDRLGTVLHVLYLIFNAGYSAPSGVTALRTDLSAEAIRLTRLINELTCGAGGQQPAGADAAQRCTAGRARLDAAGDLVPLDEQDRTRILGADRGRHKTGRCRSVRNGALGALPDPGGNRGRAYGV